MEKRKEKEKKFLTTWDVEQIYGIPRQTLANLRCMGNGPTYYKASPRKVLYRAEDLEEWLEKKLVRTAG